MTTITHTTFRDINGNRRVKIEIETIGRIYADFCNGAAVRGEGSNNFECVLQRLKEAFGYRIQRKAKIPTVTATFDGEQELKAEIMDAIVFAVTGGRVKHSRVRYMDAMRRCSHSDYYGQFVTPSVISLVMRLLPDLLKSQKQCFNDNDYLTNRVSVSGDAAYFCRVSQATTFVGYRCGGISLSDSVCIAKEAARRVLVDHLERHDTTRKTTIVRDGYTVTECNTGFYFSLDGRAVAPQDVILAFKGRVPVVYNNDVYTMLAGSMFLPSNKAILKRIIDANA